MQAFDDDEPKLFFYYTEEKAQEIKITKQKEP